VDGILVGNPNRKDHMGKWNGGGDWEIRNVRCEDVDWIVFED
jgi:allantoicase